MKTLLFFTLVISFATLFSCNKENNIAPDVHTLREVPQITGLLYRDEFGDAMGLTGNPNVNLGGSWSNEIIAAYPNPSRQQLNVHIADINSQPVHVYIVPAYYGATPEPTVVANMALFAPLRIMFERTLPAGQSGANLAVDVRDFPQGYYRLYVSISEKLYWDNLLILH